MFLQGDNGYTYPSVPHTFIVCEEYDSDPVSSKPHRLGIPFDTEERKRNIKNHISKQGLCFFCKTLICDLFFFII